MSKQLVPLAISDLSAFAKSFRKSLAALDHAPTHVELLNLLAKAAGHQNFQALRADLIPAPTNGVDTDRLQKVIRHFDTTGRMQRWPGKTSHQDLCLWVIWSCIPADQDFSEGAVSDLIKQAHTFGDHALLRRSLVDMKMLGRTPDGKIYRRIEKQPDADARALIEAITPRLAANARPG